MCIFGGYKTQTVIQIANVLSSLERKVISLKGLRTYFAALSLLASREAAKRVREKKRGGAKPENRFLISELTGATGLPSAQVKKALRSLESAGLILFSESEIHFEKALLEGAEELLLLLSGRRSPKRPIPIPRTALRFLAKSNKASTIKTTLAYILRGLTITRSGEIRAAGSVKATWISNAMNLSERSVRSARAELLELGFITGDEGSTQRKLNRTGAYFTVNLAWRGLKKPFTEAQESRGGSEGAIKSPVAEGGPETSSVMGRVLFAPPMVKNTAIFAPPYKDKKTLNRIKNQKTHPQRLNPSGVCIANKFGKEGEGTKTRHDSGSSPSIHDVRLEDLRSFGRVEELYRQAVKHRLIEGSEANAINFIAAAARATSVSGDAPRIFMGIIRAKLWHHISSKDEDRALSALRNYRRENPERFTANMFKCTKHV